MLKEIKIKGTNPSDKVFKCEGLLVKVRLLKKEIAQKNKLVGPSSLAFHLTASVCDQKGKAIPRADGKFCIYPHTITIPVTDKSFNDQAIKKGLEDILTPLISQTVAWHKSIEVAENFLADWENSNQDARPKKKTKS